MDDMKISYWVAWQQGSPNGASPSTQEEQHPISIMGQRGPKFLGFSNWNVLVPHEQLASKLTLLGTQVQTVYLPAKPLFCLPYKKRQRHLCWDVCALRKLASLQNLKYVSTCLLTNNYPRKFLPAPSNVYWFFTMRPLPNNIQSNTV